jgi:UTP-glucose-1-phosphate uridylyltransferase
MAAGMGSRYGGLKQIDSVGPNGEIIIDYSMYDAITAGFGKIVFVIRHYFEDTFREKIASKIEQAVDTAYAFQELDSCLGSFKCPDNRQKPWGTGHAILVAKDVINEPFAVINADDYYGRESFKIMANWLNDNSASPNQYAMVGYILSNTLSEHGEVARGVCRACSQMYLEQISECLEIKKSNDAFVGVDRNGEPVIFSGDEVVSMNFWGFKPSIFGHLNDRFGEFLQKKLSEPKAEFYIPDAVDYLIKNQTASVKVLPTEDHWFGVTYRSDRDKAVASINKLIDRGIYPYKLWS